MQFYEPSYLRYFMFLPLLLVLGWLSSRLWHARIRRLGHEPTFRNKLMPSYRRAEAATRIFLLLLVFSCLLLALGRPQWGESHKKIERKGVDILFLLDTSLSMLAEDVKPNRFDRARHEIKSMVRRLKGDRVGLVTFAGSAYLQTPFTLDYSAFMLFLDAVKVGHVPDPGSSLESALAFILKIFPKEDLKYKVLVLLSDGEDTFGGIQQAVKALSDAKIRVYAVGMGTTEGGPLPLKDEAGRQVGFKKDRSGNIVVSKLADAALKKITDETGGLYFPNTAAEQEIDLILKHLSSLGQRNINEKNVVEKEDHYPLFLTLAFIFLLLEMLVRRSYSAKKKIRLEQAAMAVLAFFMLTGFLETSRGLNNKANTEFEQKKYQTALENYEKAKSKNPDDASIRYNLGTALYQTSQYRETQKELQKALALTKDQPLKAKTYYNLGNTEYRLGNFDGAIQAYKEALKINPKDTDAKYNLEFVQKKKGQFDKKNGDKQKDQSKDKNQKNQQNKQDPQDQQQDQQSQQDQQDQQQKDSQQQNQDQKDQQQQNQKNQQQQSSQQQNQNQDPQKQQEQSGQQDQQNSSLQQKQDPKNQGGQGGNNEKQDQEAQQEQGQGENAKQDEPSQQKPQSGSTEKTKAQQDKQQDQKNQGQQDNPSKEDQKQGQNSQQSQEQKEQEQKEQEQKEQEKSDQEKKGEQPEPGQGQEPVPQEPDDLSQYGQGPKPEEQSQNEEGEAQGDSAGQSEQPSGPSGTNTTSGAQYQGQMSRENALKILDALHDGEKEFSDLRRPPSRRAQAPVDKDW